MQREANVRCMSVGSGLKCIALLSLEDLEREAESWDALVHDVYGGNPFFSNTWHLTWLRHFGKECRINYLKMLTPDGATIGYLPLVSRRQLFRRIPSRILGFSANRQTPVAGPLIRPEAAREVLDFFVRDVLPAMDWDLFVAKDLQDELPGAVELTEALQTRHPYTVVDEGYGNWVIEGVSNFTEYFRSRREDIRRNEKKYPKQLEALGRFHFSMIRSELTENDIADYETVYARSWKEPEKLPDFYHDLMRSAARDGSLRLGFLYLDSRPLAVQFWVVKQQRIYAMKTAYDEEFKKYAPGTLLTVRMLKELIDQERTDSLDFLKGDEDYKRNWATRRRQHKNIIVFRKNRRGSLAFVIDRKITAPLSGLTGLHALRRLQPKIP